MMLVLFLFTCPIVIVSLTQFQEIRLTSNVSAVSSDTELTGTDVGQVRYCSAALPLLSPGSEYVSVSGTYFEN